MKGRDRHSSRCACMLNESGPMQNASQEVISFNPQDCPRGGGVILVLQS